MAFPPRAKKQKIVRCRKCAEKGKLVAIASLGPSGKRFCVNGETETEKDGS